MASISRSKLNRQIAESPEPGEAQDLARKLASMGVPVFTARIHGPEDAPGRDSWSQIEASSAEAEISGWLRQPSRALCAGMGHALDVIDWDPRNDSYKTGYDGLKELFEKYRPVVYLRVRTPSGGIHWWIASLGERAQKTNLPGVDYLGRGRLAFLPGTMRRAKDADGKRRGDRLPYTVIDANLDAPLKACDGLRAILDTPQNGQRKTADQAVQDMLDAQKGERNESLLRGVWELMDAGVSLDTITRFTGPWMREAHWPPRLGTGENDIRDIASRNKNAMSDEDRRTLSELRDMRPLAVPRGTPPEEEAFWTARKDLRVIRQWAQAQQVSPWALLGEILADVIARVPPTFVLPRIVGGYGTLNMMLALTGPTSAGKSSASAVAEDAVDFGEPALLMNPERIPLGSGEGLAKNYGFWQKDSGLVRSALTSISTCYEIDTFAAVVERGGATLTAELRKFYSGETLGFGYGDHSKRIVIRKYTYRGVLVAGVQPERSGIILNDTGSGFAQRWFLLNALDPYAPDIDPPVPAQLTWCLPDKLRELDAEAGRPLLVMDVCAEAVAEIKNARKQSLRGNGDKLRGHALHTQQKFAAALALLAMRTGITEEDWSLASCAMKRSDAIRASCERELRRQRRNAALAAGHTEGIKQAAAEKSKKTHADRQIWSLVLRHVPASGRIAYGRLGEKMPQHRGKALKNALDGMVSARLLVSEDDSYNNRPVKYYRRPGR